MYRALSTTSLLAALLCVALLLPSADASAALPKAKLIGDRAVAPASAPPAVKKMISAANRIRHHPYKWGGGHGRWDDRGYDCSGAVSYVLRAGGLLDSPLTSSGFMDFGKPGARGWVQIYANHEHVFAVIAGLRWDTSYRTDGDSSGPGWSEQMRPMAGFTRRHIAALNQATSVPVAGKAKRGGGVSMPVSNGRKPGGVAVISRLLGFGF